MAIESEVGIAFANAVQMDYKSLQNKDLSSFKGQAGGFGDVLELACGTLRLAHLVVLSLVPRGGLQILQGGRYQESFVRKYVRLGESHDQLSWRALATNGPVTDSDVWQGDARESDPFQLEYLGPAGFTHAVAVPLAGPILDGYPGLLHGYRTLNQPAFDQADIATLQQFASELSADMIRARHSRIGPEPQSPASRQLSSAIFAFDQNLRPLLAGADVSSLDEVLRANMLDHARGMFSQVGQGLPEVEVAEAIERLPLADSRGDLWNFRAALHPKHPGWGGAAVAMYCLQPESSEWSMLRAADFSADDEVARLIPAIRFMREHFRRGPTLAEIARSVHLSPFHFHRRFSEILGITPKHLLLDCQIQQAKRDLADAAKDLASIATECGFAHQSHFTSRFKQATGLTPTHWRKAIANRKS